MPSLSTSSPSVSDPGVRSQDEMTWKVHEHALPERWSLLLYTDGLIEGRTGVGAARSEQA